MEEMINNSKAILFVSHDIDSIRRICKRCIWLKTVLFIKMETPKYYLAISRFYCYGIFPDDSIKEDIAKTQKLKNLSVNKNIDFDICPKIFLHQVKAELK